jgi:glucose/mannose-6-phosphate isomerase
MINLDEHLAFPKLDPQNMLAYIDGLPDQLHRAWLLGNQLPLPDWKGIQSVVVAGLGGSAIGADLLAAYAQPRAAVPIFVHRDYGLPAWARGPHTLVIASSHSGNTEETLSSFESAAQNDCRILVVTTGGKLATDLPASGAALWTFEHRGQPRSAVGFSFGLLLAAVSRLNLFPDPTSDLDSAVSAMRLQQDSLRAEVPVVKNSAKRMAGQLMGRWVTVFGADILAPVARRWKTQVNELAKAWAEFEFLPEADHNTLAGNMNPQKLFDHSMLIFLVSSFNHPRNRLRSERTRKALMLEGLNTDLIEARGDTPLAHLWTALHYGDYTAYYLAIAYGVDPTPVVALEGLKQELRQVT